jgi:hypothetical protein
LSSDQRARPIVTEKKQNPRRSRLFLKNRGS